MEKPKYKFVETQGCTAFGFTVDGQEISELSEERRAEVSAYLCDKIKREVATGKLSRAEVVRVFPETDCGADSGPCTQCFDVVSWTTWEI
jgi:hypothetical protein